MNTTRYLIRNGNVHDGTGSPPRRDDIRITGERIEEVGPNLVAKGEVIVDADGLIVSPGLSISTSMFSVVWGSIRSIPATRDCGPV
jgi:N-acyl-D-aspartate/D-glutamate deacylase